MLITTRVQIIFYVGKGIVIIFPPLSQLAQCWLPFIHLFLKLFHHSPLSYAFNLFRSSSLFIAIQFCITLLMYRDIHLFASVMTIPHLISSVIGASFKLPLYTYSLNCVPCVLFQTLHIHPDICISAACIREAYCCEISFSLNSRSKTPLAAVTFLIA